MFWQFMSHAYSQICFVSNIFSVSSISPVSNILSSMYSVPVPGKSGAQPVQTFLWKGLLKEKINNFHVESVHLEKGQSEFISFDGDNTGRCCQVGRKENIIPVAE